VEDFFMKKFILVLLTAAVLQTAFTQETPDSDEIGNSLDFVVTAARTREEAAKVSGQVTVITAEDIAESGASTITEVLETVPGLRMARDRSGVSADISMRGISSDYGRGKVLIIMDGMRLNPVQGRIAVNWDAINLSEIERIEVLDGGASVQYGDNASVGVINIITKKSGVAKTDITLSGGSFFQNEQRFSHHRPTGWGSFTVSGGHQGTQGYQNHTANDAGNGELRGIFDINDAMSLQANVGFTAGNGLIANGLTKAEFDDDPTQNKGPSSSSFSRTGVIAGLGFTWAINDTLNFDLPVSYNFVNYKSYIPSSMIYDLAPHMLGIRPKITAELRPADMSLRLTGGVDTLFAFSEVKTSYDLVQETNPTIQTLSEFTIGPWALVNFEPFPFLSLNTGLRYDTAFVKGHMDAWSGSVMGNPRSYVAGDESAQWDAFVYEAGLTVNPLDFLKVYAKYGTQFRYPYLDDLIAMPYAAGGTIGLNTGIEPEKGWTIEGGIGVNIKGIAKLDANFYYLKIDNEILSILVPSGSMVTMNLDPIDRLGTNIGVKLTPLKEYLELDIDYGFVNAEFSEGTFEGKFVPLVAAHTLSSSLILNLPFGLSFGPDVLYKSEIYQGLDNSNALPTVDPSFIWGASVRYTPRQFDGNLTVQLTAHNLADAKYASMVYAMPASMGGTTYYVDSNMGRSIKLSLQYRF
jgi:iron complex outermembrane receptor protein